jgi:PAS domain S-box-containing protein
LRLAVPAEPPLLDALYARLHDDLIRADDLEAGCSVLLDALAGEVGVGKAVLVARTDTGLRGAVSGIPTELTRSIVRELADPDSLLVDLILRGSEPNVFAAGTFPPLDFTSYVAFSFTGLHPQPALGAVLMEAGAIDERVEAAVALIQRMGPALARVGQLEVLASRTERVVRQRDLLTTIVNSLPDPVLLTNAANDIILSNQRAEQLFTAQQDDSEGRRRAIQINNLLFSSFLTQTLIGAGRSAARELNLVDTAEGSDLLFEVLSVPVETVGGRAGVISVLRDITDLRHVVGELEVQFDRSRVAEHEARRERDRLNVILENVSDPILVTDEHTNIVLMNPEADRLFVAGDDEIGNRLTRQEIQANDTQFTTLISNFLLRPEARQVERTTIVDPRTRRGFPVEVASSKILNERGEPSAIVSVIHDLTQAEDNERLARELQQLNDQLEDRIRRATLELEERNRRLEWQSLELKKASRLKSEFLANMSHELRTPINVILGYTSLMREQIYGSLTPQQDEALAKTYQTSQHLLELINDILDLSKIEAGKMPLHLEPVSVSDIVAELSEALLPLLRSKRLTYDTEVAEPVPTIRTDRTKLKQVLLNLLSNAVKFTQDGRVNVSVGPLPEGDGDGIRIVVADTGIGIKPEHLDAIFEDFRQLDQSHTREYGGTGLGLSITRKLLALLGGSVAVESSYGVGTRFTIDLPDLSEPYSEAATADG